MKTINLGNRINNIFLIKLDEGYLLIDTGYNEQFIDFCKKLTLKNIEINEIQYVLLTHAHDDHAGFLNEILDQSNAKVILHKEAAVRLMAGQNSFDGGCSSILAYAFCNLMKLFGKGNHRFNPVDRKDRYLLSDEIQNLSIEIKLPG